MSGTQSRSSEVAVGVNPETAFTAFTDEIDLWWVRGPINSYGAGKLVAMRCEPGIGGRLLEVYDQDTGEGLELARITAWEPGKHLAWQSSLDDVSIDVRFDPTDDGTIVRLEASIPEGGSDKGGTAIIRVTPRWFGAWVAKRDTTPHELHDLARFAITLHYARPAAAARWLAAAFGFEAPDALPDGEDPLPDGEDGHPWIEFHVGNCSLMIDKLVRPWITPRSLTCRGHSSTTSRPISPTVRTRVPPSCRASRPTASRRTSPSTSRVGAGGSSRPGQPSRGRRAKLARGQR